MSLAAACACWMIRSSTSVMFMTSSTCHPLYRRVRRRTSVATKVRKLPMWAAVVDGGAAHVHPHLRRLLGGEVLEAGGQGVVEAQGHGLLGLEDEGGEVVGATGGAGPAVHGAEQGRRAGPRPIPARGRAQGRAHPRVAQLLARRATSASVAPSVTRASVLRARAGPPLPRRSPRRAGPARALPSSRRSRRTVAAEKVGRNVAGVHVAQPCATGARARRRRASRNLLAWVLS